MSLQPNPILEEDLTHTRLSFEDGELDSHDISPPSSRTSTEKGKAKQSEEDTYDEEETIESSYPPTTDEAAETRRVEENLRRWEMAERERRRAARESVHMGKGGGPTLLGAVTRKASVLLSNRHVSKSSMGGLGNHRALKSTDSIDAVPLNDIDQSPRVSENPFIHPSEQRPSQSDSQSPFHNSDSKEQSSVMTEISDPSSPRSPDTFDSNIPSSQPAVHPRTSTLVPPPQPLRLPPPRTPPPAATSTHVAPMKATPAPTMHPERIEPPEQEVRWWHDWLCGCSEGPDRGGDFQAGRTNPFE